MPLGKQLSRGSVLPEHKVRRLTVATGGNVGHGNFALRSHGDPSTHVIRLVGGDRAIPAGQGGLALLEWCQGLWSQGQDLCGGQMDTPGSWTFTQDHHLFLWRSGRWGRIGSGWCLAAADGQQGQREYRKRDSGHLIVLLILPSGLQRAGVWGGRADG
ncbi:hypothetical protein GCM10017783_01070 [Deinococcus piscis]|uniref:Uncharacterized protein n=1 Tax=Deinococcus piscis TaxID=394230 RepID=A0ABQ3JX23_9DEIO|nr:hypothetical protein GCM10017783_01070 [Deinococcus piscis]